MPGCPANASEHCELLCPSNSTCNGAPNTGGEHECMVCCCFPIHILAYRVIQIFTPLFLFSFCF